jgi:hypothetical protein
LDTAGSTLTLLKTCTDSAEAATLRSLLDANGIPCVIQGEQHHAMLGVMGGAVIDMNVLVSTKDLERAQALLQAEVEPGDTDSGRSSAANPEAEESLCPVHGERATGTCSRCGTFLCARCETRGEGNSLCEDCAERKGASNESRRSSRRKLGAWLVLGFMFGPALLMVLAGLLRRLLINLAD